MGQSLWAPAEGSADQWSIAGIRDYWLGGSHHTATDQEIAEHILVGAPHLPYVVRVYRALLGRMVDYLVNAGVRQFLDLGSGLPAAGNVHEVAQNINAECRVVYVDIVPNIVAESCELLAGNDRVAAVLADLRQPEKVLDAADRCGLFDLHEPIAVLMIDVLHHISDTDNPDEFIAAYTEAMCPGSYLAIAHNDHNDSLVVGLKMFGDLYRIPVPQLTFRNRSRMENFFINLDVVEPGIVTIPLWRPEKTEDMGADPEQFPAWAGIGRKS